MQKPVGQHVRCAGRARQFDVVTQHAVACFGPSQERAQGAVGAAVGMHKAQALHHEHAQSVVVAARREAGRGEQVAAVECGVEEALMRDRAGQRRELHGVGVDEPGRVATQHHVAIVEVAHDDVVRVQRMHELHELLQQVTHNTCVAGGCA